MSHGPHMTRRRLLKTLFCSSMAMELNLLGPRANAAEPAKSGTLDLIAMGDFGYSDQAQKDVAAGLVKYATGLGKPTQGMLLLGDNFYHPMPGGFESPRWKTDFSDLYPAGVFPGPCWAILGNHDYHDTVGNEKVQLGYADFRKYKTRWTMPGKYYRVDLPKENPQVTFLMIDTNWDTINRRIHGDHAYCWTSNAERAEQAAWLETQLTSKRAPITIVVGHHPVYSDGAHGDTPELVAELGPLFEKHGVHLYLGGHDHDLQHLELEGLRTSYVISGGGGAPVHPGDKARKGAVMKPTHGFSHLTIADNRLLLRHVDPAGQIVHAFSKGAGYDWKVEG